MADDIFISYSRRNMEFVRRLAADLDRRVSGVWFDMSDIQAGEIWRQRLLDGIQGCKVFILVISPESLASREVMWELNEARKAGKRVIPVIYTTTRMSPEIGDYLNSIQYVDLRAGSYADNFETLVDGLIASGISIKGGAPERPFLRQPVKPRWGAVLGRIPGWGCAWGIGWGIFWLIVVSILVVASAWEQGFGDSDGLLILALTACGAIGGGVGGLLAGAVTMSVLQRNAPSISWKHMSPSIGIWIVSGLLGVLVSIGLAVLLINIGVIAVNGPEVSCEGLSFKDCVGQMIGGVFGYVVELMFVFCAFSLLFMAVIWFLAGILAGWWAVKRIKRLEPGITPKQTRRVTLGWGCGAVLATVATVAFLILLIALTSGS